MSNTAISEKKKALLAQKKKLLEELEYYERRIEEEKAKSNVDCYLDASSDSDEEFCITDLGPSLTQLKLEQSKLRTCIQATQELTNLQILQSEVNIIVNDPVITGEPPVKRPGTWREVTAECRIDLVPFSITFYCHKSEGRFPSTWYRGLGVVLVKAAHEAELVGSVLATVDRPSDAVEVLRSYAGAYRSRRSSLARLATKYADSLYMEPLAEGGYLLKCGGLLQMAWRLENKWSPLAPFHHRMKFDLEYMEEKYINTITQCHKQLSDPTISTDERTLLLSKIIATCLEANPASESADSDQESRMPKRRATLDQEIEEPEIKKKKEVMAPPKSLPKKAKVSKSVNSRTNGGSERDRASDRQSDRDINDIVNSNVSSNGQRTVDNAPKVITSMKNSEVSNKNTDNIVENEKQKTKKTKSATQVINTDKQTNNIERSNEKAQTGKKLEGKGQNKKVVNKNVDSSSNKKSKDAPTKTNQLSGGNIISNKKHDVGKEKTGIDDKKNKTPTENNGEEANNNIANQKKSDTKSKPFQTNKKVSKENIDANTAKNIPSKENPKAISKVTEKGQNSVHKNIEKNANNKIKDKIADIATKVSKTKNVDSVKNKQTTNKDIDSNSNQEKRHTPTVSTDVALAKTKKAGNTEKNADKNSVTNKVNSATKKLVNNVEKQINAESNVAPAKKTSNKEKTTKSSDAKVKSKVTAENTPEFNNEQINKQVTADTESTKTKKQTNVKNTDKNSINNEQNKINKTSDHKQKSNEKPKNNDIAKNKKVIAKENKISYPTNMNAVKNLPEKDKNNPKAKMQEMNTQNDIKKSDNKKSVLPLRMQNNLKITRKSIGNIKVKQSEVKAISKIPQKKLAPLNENVLKKNPLRMSPRHMASTFNSTSSSVKQIQKTTHIPRLAKPMFKVK